jgi:hypothetical protein
MDYKFTILNDIYVVVTEDVEFATTINGGIFRSFFAEQHPEAADNMVTGYEDPEGIFVFDSNNSLIDIDGLKDIPEELWERETWG